jgi:hypothetical protein
MNQDAVSKRRPAELSGQFEHFAVIAHFDQYKRRGIAVNLDGFDHAEIGAHRSHDLDQFPVGLFQVNEQHNPSRIPSQYCFEQARIIPLPSPQRNRAQALTRFTV